MAEIWFGDLDKHIRHEVSDIKNLKLSLEKLYKNWETKHPEIFKNFKPLLISENNELDFNEDFFDSWEDDEFKIPFVLQGGNFSEQNISWGWQMNEHMENKLVSKFSNDLMKIVGTGTEITFTFQITADDGYEDYSIYITPNFESDSPDIELTATFYGDDEEEDNW